MTAPDFTDRPLIYVAGPHSADTAAGTRNAIAAAAFIVDLGGTPLIPHLSLLWYLHLPHPVDWWYAYDLALLARCDALYRLPGDSTGAVAEVAYADKRGIPVASTATQLMLLLDRLGGA